MGSKTIKSLLSIAAPIAGALLLPGVGASLGIPGLVGASGAATSLGGALGGGIGGAGGGLIGGGGLKSALLGGATGAAGGYLANGGLSELGKASGLTGEGSVLGTVAGTPLANGVGPTQGSGILGSATRGLSDIGSALSTGIGGGGSTYGNLGAALIGGANSLNANDKAQKALLEAQRNSLGALDPYLTSGAAANSRLSDLLGTSGNTTTAGYGSLDKPFTATDLQNDPGYQFQLSQGNQALDRKAAAGGNYFSGSALKAAQDYGQGLADTTFNNAYTRDLQNKQQTYGMYSGQAGAGQSAAGTAGSIFDNIGNARANADISSSNILNRTLSSLLSGSGAKRLVGYGQNGQPIYA